MIKKCRKCEGISKWKIVDSVEWPPKEIYACNEHTERYLTNGCSVYRQTPQEAEPVFVETFGKGGHSDSDSPPPMTVKKVSKPS